MPTVLVIDDEIEVVEFLCNFLKRFNITAHKAVNGEGAIKAFAKEKAEWLFLDIKMPDMDGFDVLKSIKKMDPGVQTIMITGRDDKESQKKAKNLGAIDYIIKPLDLEELHQKVQMYILKK